MSGWRWGLNEYFNGNDFDGKFPSAHVQLLRGLFKGGTATDETIAAAYMTGILPIKKYGTESALNDFVSFHNRDDVLTLLIHLGYLSYNVEKRKTFIPNSEVKEVFEAAVRGLRW